MTHKGTQALQTARLLLRPFRVQDAAAMYRNWASDPQVTKFLTWPTHTGPDVTQGVLQDWCAQYADPTYYHWGIEIKEDHELIGAIGVNRLDDFTQSATIGYCIGHPWWGQSFVTEAFGAVLGFLFDAVGARCVNACHDPRNPASGRVMQKCGLRREGVWRAGGKNNQGVCDEVWYSILDTEYAAHRQTPDWDIWNTLYQQARAVQNPRQVSPFVDAGGVAAALLTAGGHIYTGVCIDTASSLGMCAERNAAANMLTHGESRVTHLVAVMPDGQVGPPCGACRELLLQLDADNADMQILLTLSPKKTVTLAQLVPVWWGAGRYGAD